MRLLKQLLVLLGAVLVAMQCVSTVPKSPRMARNTTMTVALIDPKVGAILNRSCQDCHSASTRWPWYSHVAPVSWILAKDVNRGRAKLDFSQWVQKPPSANERMEVCDAVSNGTMPLRAYTLIHRNARLSKQDVDGICDWAVAPDANGTTPQLLGQNGHRAILASSDNTSNWPKGPR